MGMMTAPQTYHPRFNLIGKWDRNSCSTSPSVASRPPCQEGVGHHKGGATLSANVASSKGFCICPLPKGPKSPPLLALLQWLSFLARSSNLTVPSTIAFRKLCIIANASSCTWRFPHERKPPVRSNAAGVSKRHHFPAFLPFVSHFPHLAEALSTRAVVMAIGCSQLAEHGQH